MNFKEYQDATAAMPLYDDPVLGLVGEVGEVIELIKKDRRLGTRRKVMTKDRLQEELGDILWYLSAICTANHIHLGELAEGNVAKLNERHGL